MGRSDYFQAEEIFMRSEENEISCRDVGRAAIMAAMGEVCVVTGSGLLPEDERRGQEIVDKEV